MLSILAGVSWLLDRAEPPQAGSCVDGGSEQGWQTWDSLGLAVREPELQVNINTNQLSRLNRQHGGVSRCNQSFKIKHYRRYGGSAVRTWAALPGAG